MAVNHYQKISTQALVYRLNRLVAGLKIILRKVLYEIV